VTEFSLAFDENVPGLLAVTPLLEPGEFLHEGVGCAFDHARHRAQLKRNGMSIGR
jgi:hypothetical protein